MEGNMAYLDELRTRRRSLPIGQMLIAAGQGMQGKPYEEPKTSMSPIEQAIMTKLAEREVLGIPASEQIAQQKLDVIKNRRAGIVDGKAPATEDISRFLPEREDMRSSDISTPMEEEVPEPFIQIPTGEYDPATGREKYKPVKNPKYEAYLKQREKSTKGFPAETAGKASMLEQAERDLMGIEELLFPGEGKKERFSRGLATMSNLPMSRLPILGRLIPDQIPFHTSAKKIGSRMQNALEAKLRIETGAAATQDEFNRLMERFGISGADTYESAKDKFNRLLDFMRNAAIKVDPQGNYTYYRKNTQEPYNIESIDSDNPDGTRTNLKTKYGLE